MKLVARSTIIGINDDEGLRALDGIKEFSEDVDSEEKLVELFKEKYPEFRADYIEIVKE